MANHGQYRRLLAPTLAVLLLPAFVAGLWRLTVLRPRITWNAGKGLTLDCFSPDGKTLLLTGDPKEEKPPRGVHFWDVASGRARLALGKDWEGTKVTGFSPDSRFLLAGPDVVDGDQRLWDAATGEEVTGFRGKEEGKDGCFPSGFSPDGRFLLVRREIPGERELESLQFWDVTARRVRATIKARWPEVVFASGGRRFGLLQRDGNTSVVGAQLWALGEAPGGATLLKDLPVAAEHAALSRDLKLFAAITFPKGSRNPAEVKVWDLATGKVRASATHTLPPGGQSFQAFFSEDGKFLICHQYDWDAVILEVERGQAVATYRARTVFSPDGKWVLLPKLAFDFDWVTRGRPNTGDAELLEAATRKHRGPLREPRKPFTLDANFPPPLPGLDGTRHRCEFRFSPDSRVVMMTRESWLGGLGMGHPSRSWRPCRADRAKRADRQVAVRLWDVETAAEVATFLDCGNPLFSPDGKLLALYDEDGTVRIWDVPPRKPVGFILWLSAALWGITVGGAWLLRRVTRRPAAEARG